MLMSSYYEFGFRKFNTEQIIRTEQNDTITKSNNTEALGYKTCTAFLQESLNIVIDDAFFKKLAKYCFTNNTGQNNMEQFFDADFLRNHLANTSCEARKLHFLENPKPLVALASFPGSGNTWTRELLEAITGIYTGSIYTDTMAFFTGSQLCPTDGRVFIVKTHIERKDIHRQGCKVKGYSSAIYILRNPYDSIIAEFNRHTSGKTEVANETEFKTKTWRRYVKNMSGYWMRLTEYWLLKFNKPVYVLVYEHLQNNYLLETYKLMQFIEIPVQLKALYCLSARKFDTYHRKYKPAWMAKENLFDQSSKDFLNRSIESIAAKLNKTEGIPGALRSYLL